MSEAELFERLIEACGISEVFAPRAMRAALGRAGIEPEGLDAASLARALPEIERCVRLYLGPDADAHLEEVRALTVAVD